MYSGLVLNITGAAGGQWHIQDSSSGGLGVVRENFSTMPFKISQMRANALFHEFYNEFGQISRIIS